MSDIHRQCVALSRARDGLVIVGDKNMGGQRQSTGFSAWRRLIRLHREKGCLIELPGTDDDLRRYLQVPNDAMYERLGPQ